jgi:hypothetical protein
MFCCGGARDDATCHGDGAQVKRTRRKCQLISTLAALIVEPPRADAASEARTAARLHGVLGEGEGRGAGRVWRMAYLAWRGGADVQAGSDRRAIESPRHAL